MKALVINYEGQIQVIDKEWSYQEISNIVGGLIQPIYFNDDSYFAYINEEGKLLGMPENRIVTNFWYESGETIMLGDYIAGNAIFFGEINDEGDTTEVPEFLINFFDKEYGVVNV